MRRRLEFGDPPPSADPLEVTRRSRAGAQVPPPGFTEIFPRLRKARYIFPATCQMSPKPEGPLTKKTNKNLPLRADDEQACEATACSQQAVQLQCHSARRIIMHADGAAAAEF